MPQKLEPVGYIPKEGERIIAVVVEKAEPGVMQVGDRLYQLPKNGQPGYYLDQNPGTPKSAHSTEGNGCSGWGHPYW